MSNLNQDDWKTPIMRGTFRPSHGPVSRSARTISARLQFKETQPVTEEWIIPNKEQVPVGGLPTNSADTVSEATTSAMLAPESNDKPYWATPIDEGFIHPEGYTTKVVGLDSPLASRLADMTLGSYAPKHTIKIPAPREGIKLDIEERRDKTSTSTPGPPSSISLKQADVMTPPLQPTPPHKTALERSVGTQTCVKTTHSSSNLSPSKCACLTNGAVQFDGTVEVNSGGHSGQGSAVTEEPERPSIHRHLAPADVLGLVQKFQVTEHTVLDSLLTTSPKAAKKKDKWVTEREVKTPLPSSGPLLKSPSKGPSTDEEHFPSISIPTNTPLKQPPVPERCVTTARYSPESPPNSPSKQFLKDGTPSASPSSSPNTPVKRAALITDFFAKIAKSPSPPQPPSPSLDTTSREFPKGGGGGATPPPPSPPPNTPSKQLSKEPSPSPPPQPPANTPSKELDDEGGRGETPPLPSPPPNTPSKEAASYPPTSSASTPPNAQRGGLPESGSGNEAQPPVSPPRKDPTTEPNRPGSLSLSLVIPNHDGEQFNPTDPKPLTDGYHKPSLADYTFKDDYPSPDPGSDSPITPLWLEMKNMVDEFILKTEEEEVNKNIAMRPESIPLPSSGPTSPSVEAQSPNLSLTPRMLASLENTTISVRMDEQGRVRVGLKAGAGLIDGGSSRPSSQPLDTPEAELSSIIAHEVQKMIQYLMACEEWAIAAGETETAWERDQKALTHKEAAAIQVARDAWGTEDCAETPEAAHSLSHIHADSIAYLLSSPQGVGTHVKANGEIRETTVYFSKEKLEAYVSLICQTTSSALLQAPQWKKESFKMLSPSACDFKSPRQTNTEVVRVKRN